MSHTWGNGNRLDGGQSISPSVKVETPRSKGMTFFTNEKQQKAMERAAKMKKEDLKTGTKTLEQFLNLDSPGGSKAPLKKPQPKPAYVAQNGVASSSKVKLDDAPKPKKSLSFAGVKNKKEPEDTKEARRPQYIVDLTGSQSDETEDERPTKRLKQKTLDKIVVVSPGRPKPKPVVPRPPTQQQVETRFYDLTMAELEAMLEREERVDAVFEDNKPARDVADSKLSSGDRIAAYVATKDFEWEQADS